MDLDVQRLAEMRAVYQSLFVVALAGCLPARSDFTTTGASAERDDGCVTKLVCSNGGNASLQIVALISAATLVSAVTALRFLR